MGLGASGIKAFLTALAVEGGVSASTQNQALSALLFLYRDVLGIDSPWMSELIRTKRPARLPGVLMRGVALLLDGMSGVHGLMARMLDGTRMRSRLAGDCGEHDRPSTSGCRRSAWAYLLSVDQPMAGASGVQYASCPLRGLPCVISSKRYPC
ncbi:MAG TPA: phage integrase N-terminal SAM-like domain-containing protein [Aquimonas sp.]|nr:phage integrase N-terminal SAM-like domain-containing protein [Aquimonas sp.]